MNIIQETFITFAKNNVCSRTFRRETGGKLVQSFCRSYGPSLLVLTMEYCIWVCTRAAREPIFSLVFIRWFENNQKSIQTSFKNENMYVSDGADWSCFLALPNGIKEYFIPENCCYFFTGNCILLGTTCGAYQLILCNLYSTVLTFFFLSIYHAHLHNLVIFFILLNMQLLSFF